MAFVEGTEIIVGVNLDCGLILELHLTSKCAVSVFGMPNVFRNLFAKATLVVTLVQNQIPIIVNTPATEGPGFNMNDMDRPPSLLPFFASPSHLHWREYWLKSTIPRDRILQLGVNPGFVAEDRVQGKECFAKSSNEPNLLTLSSQLT